MNYGIAKSALCGCVVFLVGFFYARRTLQENVQFYGEKEMPAYFQWENVGNCD